MELKGIVEEIRFRNEENGYTVFVLAAADTYETVSGIFPALAVGEHVALTGAFYEHAQYGTQFKAEGFRKTRPQTAADIEAYLSSGLFKGIGPSTARQMVDYFGPEVLDVLDMAPQRLLELPGIGKAKLAVIMEGYEKIRESAEVLQYLQGLGLSALYCNRIFQLYGKAAREKIEENPYTLTDALERFSFRQADSLAGRMGLSQDSPFRLLYGLKAVLSDAAQDGNMFLPEQEMLARAGEMLNVSEEVLAETLAAAALRRLFVRTRLAEGEEPVCYLAGYYHAEARAAERLLTLRRAACRFEGENVREDIARFEKETGIALAPQQAQAVEAALCEGILIITGGPGTGKTTTLNCILRLLEARGENILLAAPTGRAAKRMAEVTGKEAKTIHRMLEYAPSEEESFGRNAEKPLECDALIVDECSMLDIFLFRALLEALPAGARLILVGDADQLPSVGPGNVLHDVIASGLFPVAGLTEIFRQAAQSLIVTNAHRINKGEMPLLNQKGQDFFFVDAHNEAEASKTLLSLVCQRLPAAFFVPAEEIMVLCPQKKGECGVININRLLQRVINPPRRGAKECQTGDWQLRRADKIMQMRNNYQQSWRRGPEEGEGVFNGDMGKVADAGPGGVSVMFDDGRLSEYDLTGTDDLSLAYAVSIHKSQGCEFDYVVVPLVRFTRMLYTRNLLYTAVTRAKKGVILVGRRDILKHIVENDSIRRRYSGLDVRLRVLDAVV